ncbi:DeoR/GlpR family transcriptional regulator of sugar metabolism [Pararhizobium capsulatum DSM 1112]|uniref:DeoR/GlpR family transcriptional regulator of sugar metabolism n=1 Tax=Pararhizobium capsulatum DSM 1112 TaxID=1121113 RepID=A0ABU0BY70_9HYPH|nr:hypothetical protein [Pararhizobium capsulatum]MDQ0323200.1 DeoR/GlpR family transcriptional regulator of sugar metabolism [Pararhizobium capsulatum DSM 1112]
MFARQGLSLYTQDEQVLRVKQSMIRIARKRILLVDESKFHFSALNHVADLSVFDVVIIPQTVDERIIQYLQQNGINLELV